MTICPACGTENSAERKFCGGCGAPLALFCPACGTANAPGMRFCGECGAQLAATQAVAQASPPEPAVERRLVSVLFADLVGFTPLSARRDAEETQELLARYFETSRRLIELYGGTVEKFIGDAVMAVWGTPTATEDDAERAVRAALDLAASVLALGDEIGVPELRARAGVLTGEATVTLGAQGEGMVAGDLVNSASRVQSAAEPGAVFVGESTRRATEQTIAYDEAGSFELKGKEGLTPLWRALRVVSGARGSLKSHGLEGPFVGRDRELRQIKDLFHASADERKVHLVSVTGVGGIGKSRLAWEFYKYFDGLAQVVYWHRGRCLAYGEGVTYWALADMVRMRCRIAEDERPASAIQKLRSTVEEHVPDPDERGFLEPRLAQLLGLGELEGTDQQELFAAWGLFFERLADVYPTVLVFEDLHWADESLLDFVEHLLERSRSSPIYVITLARPELIERRPTWGAGLRNFSSLHLEPLPAPAMEEILSGLVPGLPAALRAQILDRAEGIPLYAVETVRMLLDRGVLVREGSVYRPVGEIDSLEVPETLHALIAARLDGLRVGERRLLQDGAVLGKTFTKPALAALTGLSEADLDSLLASLVRKELLDVQADPRSPEHGQYGFLQDLVRHVAYETLSRRERKARHLAAAEHLGSSLGEEDVAEVVASHLLDAYESAPAARDAAEIKDKAREALTRAGERAGSLAAAAEAQRYFEQAAELTDAPLVQAALADRAGQMAWRASRPTEARALLEQARSGYEAEGEPRAEARVSARLADLDVSEGYPRQAIVRLESALAGLAGEPDADLATVAASLGRYLGLIGEFEQAAPHLELALELAETLDLRETLAEALNSKAVLLSFTDRLYEARVLLEGALELSLARDLHAPAIRAYNNLVYVLGSSDRYVEALATLNRGLELSRRVGDRYWEALFLGEFGTLQIRLGRWDEALAHVAEAAEHANVTLSTLPLVEVVHVHCERGDVEESRARLARHAAARESDDPQTVASYLAADARVLRAEGKAREALTAASEVLATREDLGMTSWWFKVGCVEALEAALATRDDGKVAELLGMIDALRPGELTPFLKAHRRRFQARRAPHDATVSPDADFAVAEELFRELETPFDLAITLLEHGESLIARGQRAEAEPLVGEARGIFEQLRARPWLERTSRAADTGSLVGAGHVRPATQEDRSDEPDSRWDMSHPYISD